MEFALIPVFVSISNNGVRFQEYVSKKLLEFCVILMLLYKFGRCSGLKWFDYAVRYYICSA